MAKRQVVWLITCEHASNRIPSRWEHLFLGESAERLQTHEGYDEGAFGYAQWLSHALSCPLFSGEWSRLVIELNRSLRHPKLFSSIMKPLPVEEKQEAIEAIYMPFRKSVLQWIEHAMDEHREAVVFHISCHTFTPVFQGIERKTLFGVLYDPKRSLERVVSRQIACAMRPCIGRGKVHCNKPYLGISDAHVTDLRKRFDEKRYIGIEIEISSHCFLSPCKDNVYNIWLPQLTQALQKIACNIDKHI